MSQVTPTCPNCGASVSAQAKFCRACGKPIELAKPLPAQPAQPAPAAALPSQPTCPHCGAAISPTAQFCRACGKAVSAAPPQPQVLIVPVHPAAAPVQPKPAVGTSAPGAQSRKTLLFALGGVALVCVCLATCLVGSMALSGPTKIAQPAPQGPTLPPSRATSVAQSPVPQTRVAPVVRQTLVSKSVAPSNQPQTVSWNNAVSVTVPANGVTKAQTLAISAATNPRPTSSDSLQVMDVFEIKLGDQTRFAQPLKLELAFDPQKVSSPDDVGMAYWNDQAQTWIPVPSRVDAKRNVVTTHATHLSFWTWYYKWRGWDVERSLDFVVVYDPKQTFTIHPRQMSGKDFANFLLGELRSAFGKYCGKRTDSGCSLFKAPAMSDDEGIERVWIFAGKAASNPQDPEWKRFPEHIVFPDFYQSELTFRHAAAHELFHAIQARYFYMTYHFWPNQWYLEGTADYAAAKIVLNDKSVMGHDELNSRFLEQSLTVGESAHAYATSHFFDYLFSHNPGLTFKEMWDAVADPAIYDTGSVLGPLDKYLESKLGAGKGMGYQFKQFAQFLVFDPTSPVKLKKASPAKDFGNFQCAETFPANKTEVVCELSLPNYSAPVWGLLPEMEAGKTTRTIKVEQIDPTVSAVLVHLKGDKRIAPPYYAMTLLVPPTVEVSKGAMIFVSAAPLLSATKSGMVGTAKLT